MAQGFKRSSCPATRLDAHTLGSLLLDDQKKRVIRRNQLAANVVTKERLDTPGWGRILRTEIPFNDVIKWENLHHFIEIESIFHFVENGL